MMKKLLWALIVAVLIWTGFKVADVRQAKKRQELGRGHRPGLSWVGPVRGLVVGTQ